VAPELSVPKEFSAAEGKPAQDRPAQEKPEESVTWWRSFKDPLLESLIIDAVHHNKELDVAIARLNESRALSEQAFQDLLPGTVVDLGYRSELLSTTQIPNASYSERRNDSYRTGLDVSWELDFVGGLRRKLEASEAQSEAVEGALQDALRIVIADVANNYFQLRGLQHQRSVAHRNLTNQGGTLQVVESLVRAGEASELDQTRTKAQQQTTLSTLPPLEEGIRTTIYRLSVLTGRNPAELLPVLLPEQPLPQYAGPGTLEDPAALIRRRPDVRVAERQLASATAGIGVATANFYPKVSFNGSVSLQATSLSALSDGAEVYGVGPRLTWLGLNINRIRSQIRAAEAKTDGAIANYERVVLNALEEAEAALIRLSSERTRRDSLREAAQQSRRAVELAQEQFRIGNADLLTVLDSERDALQAESELARSETRLLLNLIGVYKAFGGGWAGAHLEEAA
jgi:multidrug efflux system outer membrane protein